MAPKHHQCWHCHCVRNTHTQQTGKTNELPGHITQVLGQFPVLALFCQGSYAPFLSDTGGSLRGSLCQWDHSHSSPLCPGLRKDCASLCEMKMTAYPLLALQALDLQQSSNLKLFRLCCSSARCPNVLSHSSASLFQDPNPHAALPFSPYPRVDTYGPHNKYRLLAGCCTGGAGLLLLWCCPPFTYSLLSGA